MVGNRKYGRIGRGAPSLILAAAALIALPSAGFAVAGLDGKAAPSLATDGTLPAFTPASVDPELAKFVAERTSGKTRRMRFTPAGIDGRPNRSVTVAVRVDEDAAQAISVRSAIASAKEQVASSPAVRISPTRYNLGLARGYQSFAQAPELSKSLSQADVPDLSAFAPAAVTKDEPSRFAARIALEENEKAGRAPRTLEGIAGQSVDLAGSYRVTRNLDVTAGVRYSQERDRLAPLADTEEHDAQAVYIGTQFRF